MTGARRPQGYVGHDHQTVGTDILAVLKTVNLPEITLGKDLAERLRAVKPDQWYPIGEMLELLERLDQRLGTFHLKQVGWTIIQNLPSGALAPFRTARAILEGMEETYRYNNRGHEIGHWRVVSFSADRAELEKTTPHHCVMEEGIIEEMLRGVGVSSKVSQTLCFRRGAPLCHFVVEPRRPDERWGA